MPYWMAAMAAIQIGTTIAGSIMNSNSSRKSARAQAAWQEYNANMAYGVAMNNIQASLAISKFNAGLAMAQGKINAAQATSMSEFNASMVHNVAMYNDRLYENELRQLWQKHKLDIKLLEEQRAYERGGIRARQAASGTVIGVGSNKDVIVGQMTMEAMDAAIIKHGADIQAARIANSRAQSLWMGEMEKRKILFEGRQAAIGSMASASASAMGTMAQAAIQANADYVSAQYAKEAGMYGVDFTNAQGSAEANNHLWNGFFKGAGQAASFYFQNKALSGAGMKAMDTPAPYTGNQPMTPGIPGLNTTTISDAARIRNISTRQPEWALQ